MVAGALDFVLVALGGGQQGDVADQVSEVAVAQHLQLGQNARVASVVQRGILIPLNAVGQLRFAAKGAGLGHGMILLFVCSLYAMWRFATRLARALL